MEIHVIKTETETKTETPKSNAPPRKRKWVEAKRPPRPKTARDMADDPSLPHAWCDNEMLKWAKYHAEIAAAKYSFRPGAAGDAEDIAQEIMINMMKARSLYKASRGVRFTSYFGRFVRTYAYRHASNMCRESGFAMGDRTNGSSRVPAKLTISIDAAIERPDDESRAFDIDDGRDCPQEAIMREETKRQRGDAIRNAIATLDLRSRKVIRLRFFADMTLDDIGARIGISKERVRQIEAAALKKMGLAMKRPPELVASTRRRMV